MDNFDDYILSNLWRQNLVLLRTCHRLPIICNEAPNFDPAVFAGTQEDPLITRILLQSHNLVRMLIITFTKSLNRLIKLTAILHVEYEFFVVARLEASIIVNMD